MGTVTHLRPMRRQGSEDHLMPIVVGSHGFSLGAHRIVWQSVSEIRGSQVERPIAGEAFLEFDAGGSCLRVREGQPGFPALEAAMTAAFPATTAWREAISSAPAGGQAVLFRRA